MNNDFTTPLDLRAAWLAHILARAVRDDEVAVPDALRVIKHELRRRNANQKINIRPRSVGAEAVIDKYAEMGVVIPKNSSDDALHADHVYPVTEEILRTIDSVDQWVEELRRLRTVVCVTAAENYRLAVWENQGLTGPAKYAKAGIGFTGPDLPWATQPD